MSEVHALLVPVGPDLYAVPVDWTREVVAAPVVTPLVTAPARVLGLFNLRGQIVPLLDTAALLGVGTVDSPEFAVVVSCPEGLVALAATDFPESQALEAPVGGSELPGTAGQYRVGHQVATLLDPRVLLSPERLRGTEMRVDVAAGGDS